MLRRAGQFGTLAPGAAADLLILNANPLENIRNTRSIESVWITGKKALLTCGTSKTVARRRPYLSRFANTIDARNWSSQNPTT